MLGKYNIWLKTTRQKGQKIHKNWVKTHMDFNQIASLF